MFRFLTLNTKHLIIIVIMNEAKQTMYETEPVTRKKLADITEKALILYLVQYHRSAVGLICL